jgi:hypothetical protein
MKKLIISFYKLTATHDLLLKTHSLLKGYKGYTFLLITSTLPVASPWGGW